MGSFGAKEGLIFDPANNDLVLGSDAPWKPHSLSQDGSDNPPGPALIITLPNLFISIVLHSQFYHPFHSAALASITF